MAIQEQLVNITLPASADMSDNQYKFVVTSSGSVALATAGVPAVGILQNKPDEAGKACAVAIGHVVKVEAGAALTVDSEVMSDSTGRAVAATSGNSILGVALEAASAAGEVVKMLFAHDGEKA